MARDADQSVKETLIRSNYQPLLFDCYFIEDGEPTNQEELKLVLDTKEQELLDKRQIVADKSLIAAVKILVEIRRASDLQAYQRHPKISPKFGQNYRTKLTFGLHLGWAIEGAIGTEYKIDSLYLSPDASIAMRVEEFCSEYESHVLLTEDVVSALSEKAKSTLRLIDNVVMNESKTVPRQLYSFDVHFNEEIDNSAAAGQQEGYELGGFLKHQDYDQNNFDVLTASSVEYVFQLDHDFHGFKSAKKDAFD